MATLFKNPWAWLLVLFLVIVAGMGLWLFGGRFESAEQTIFNEQGAMNNEQGAMNDGQKERKEEKQEKLSEEISEEIVRQLEEGNGVPGEDGGQNDQLPITNDQSGTKNEREVESNEQGIENNEQGTVDREKNNEEGGLEIENRTLKIQDVIVNRLVSWGFAEMSGRKIDTIVIHSTYNALGGDPFSVEKIIGIYKSYGVSPHYLIARDGMVYRLVEEKSVAYHAGDSVMLDGRKNVNDFSIGIEIIGKDDGSPSDEQYVSLEKLIADIKSRNDINHVVGHSDIAPGRKTDPWGFKWKEIGGKEL